MSVSVSLFLNTVVHVAGGLDGENQAVWLNSHVFIVNVMSEKHTKYYRIRKYLLSIIDKRHVNINGYYVKTTAMNNSKKCSDLSDNSAECVLEMFCELTIAYEVEKLKPFHLDVNIFNRSRKRALIIQELIKMIHSLKSVSNSDSWDTIALKFIKKKTTSCNSDN